MFLTGNPEICQDPPTWGQDDLVLLTALVMILVIKIWTKLRSLFDQKKKTKLTIISKREIISRHIISIVNILILLFIGSNSKSLTGNLHFSTFFHFVSIVKFQNFRTSPRNKVINQRVIVVCSVTTGCNSKIWTNTGCGVFKRGDTKLEIFLFFA